MKAIARILITLLVALLTVIVVKAIFVAQYSVPANHESIGLLRGDRLLVNRLSYGFRVPMEKFFGYNRWGNGVPGRGSMVAFFDPLSSHGSEAVMIDRCAALPGDTVWVDIARKCVAAKPSSPSSLPIPVPRAGKYINITPQNARLLWTTLQRHENMRVALLNDTALALDGKKISKVKFSQDYYLMSDYGLAYGLVPHSCLIGHAFSISYSIDADKPFGKRFRKQRFFTPIC